MGCHGSLLVVIVKTCAEAPDMRCRRLHESAQTFSNNVGATLADEIGLRSAGRPVVILVQARVPLPGTENLFDREALVINGGTMVPGCDAGDFPLDAVFPEEPFPPVEQKPGEGPSDVSKSDECEINLSRFLFHGPSVLPLW
jgi:hypothetical protein